MALDATAQPSGSERLQDALGSQQTVAAGDGRTVSSVAPRAPRETASLAYPSLVAVDPAHYVAERDLARGGMGRIRIAHDRRIGRTVAIKETLIATGPLAERFEREARINGRLQHPSIMPVYEAGTWPSGLPFFAMKLVSGRALEDVIADARTLDERFALLPSVLAVADAIAYAHSEGVIHRDLKPRNVLVGAFGETVVIDWGLAKDLDAVDAPRPDGSTPAEMTAPRYGSDTRGLETEAGEVMGTPAYMPPEQARGESVDARADVYAIGAILYQLLAGRPPHGGASIHEVLASVLAGPPAALRNLQPGTPPDLLAIVDKAMAYDAAARYPTAQELADDLRRFQTGQLVGAHRYSARQLVRRWFRRHRTAVLVALVALGVLATVGIVSVQRVVAERARAEDQRGLAIHNAVEIEEINRFMLSDLRAKLAPLGRSDILSDVVTRVTAYYEASNARDPENLRRRSVAFRLLANVLADQGKTDVAIERSRSAVTLAEQVVAATGSIAALESLATARHDLSRILSNSGDLRGAFDQARGAVVAWTTLSLLQPGISDHVVAIASGQKLMGVLRLQLGDKSGALAMFEAALATVEGQLRRTPPSDIQRIEAFTVIAIGVSFSLADTLKRVGRPRDALARFRAAVVRLAPVRAAKPEDAGHRHTEAVLRRSTGGVLITVGDPGAAVQELQSSVALLRELSAGDATSVRYRGELAIALDDLGRAQLALNDTASASATFEQARSLLKAIVDRDPKAISWQLDYAEVLHSLGEVNVAAGDLPDALASFEQALAVREGAVSSDPNNAHYQRGVTSEQETIGDLLLTMRDVDGALRSYQTALATIHRLATTDVGDATLKKDASAIYRKVGSARRGTRDLPGALESLAASKQMLLEAETIQPSDDLALEIARAHELVGDLRSEIGDRGGAHGEYQAALARTKQLIARASTAATTEVLAAAVATLERKLARRSAGP